MKLSMFIILLLCIACAKSDHNVNQIQRTLWSSVEHQLEKLTDELDLLKSKLNELLPEKGLSLSDISTLSDDDVDDIIGIIKINLELHCGKTESYYETPQPQPLMRIADYITEKCTPSILKYRYYSFSGTKFNFKLRATNDANIELAKDDVGTQPVYEVAFGGWSNTKSIIRYNAKTHVAAYEGAILKECEYIGFWIRWDSGFIQVGYEGDKKPFMSYNATNFYKVNYIGIRSGYGCTASWIF